MTANGDLPARRGPRGQNRSQTENTAHKPLAQPRPQQAGPNNRQRTLRRAFLLLPTIENCTVVKHYTRNVRLFFASCSCLTIAYVTHYVPLNLSTSPT